MKSSSGLHLVVALSELRDEPARYHIVGTRPEREALAKRFELRALSALEADVTVSRLQGGAALRVEGRLQADLTQDCVVSLEPVEQHIDDHFRLDFGQSADVVDAESGELLLSSGVDDPEPMPQGTLDIGELVAEHLALAIDPYPRKPGIDLEQVLPKDGSADNPQPSPFAVLAGLKTKS